jgi:hypothetical protein
MEYLQTFGGVDVRLMVEQTSTKRACIHPIRLYITLNMAPKGSSSSISSKGSTPAASSLSPPLNNNRRRSPRLDAEKLDMVCNYMRNEFRWGVADFVKALASADGSNNTRRKAAFAAAASGMLARISPRF